MVLEQALGKPGQKPGFSSKSKEAVPKTEVLEQPQLQQLFLVRLDIIIPFTMESLFE
ncbi:MAG: hypothetical protein LBB83_05060 [Treponema sp.]|jgi:hypothetical protein|nr:hypothetical protein [Treponema sp.]